MPIKQKCVTIETRINRNYITLLFDVYPWRILKIKFDIETFRIEERRR